MFIFNKHFIYLLACYIVMSLLLINSFLRFDIIDFSVVFILFIFSLMLYCLLFIKYFIDCRFSVMNSFRFVIIFVSVEVCISTLFYRY